MSRLYSPKSFANGSLKAGRRAELDITVLKELSFSESLADIGEISVYIE